jgi:aspartyl protease family protein
MNDQIPDLIYYGIWLAILVSAFAVRRVPLKSSFKMALAWVGIFAVVVMIASGRERYAGWWSNARQMIDGPDQSVVGGALSVPMDASGSFFVTATINGVERRMLVDSGASSTTISAETARAAKIDIEESPFPIILDTAGGPITARVATIHKLVIGPIQVTDLGAYVTPTIGDTDVVGMNFLSRLKSWHVEGRTLMLRPQS